MKNYLHNDKPVHFIFPIDGDYIFPTDGYLEGEKIVIVAKVFADSNAKIMVNDVLAQYVCDHFEATIKIDKHETNLMALDLNSNECDLIRVFRVEDFKKRKYRVSSDDNIMFLYDINKNKEVYKSIFENPYLKMYKKVHDELGACIDLNLFYSTDTLGLAKEHFDLSMMTDKFKEEFEENSNWLKLSFHSNTNDPLWPYRNTTYQQISFDMERVHKEIKRFAGKKCLPKTTTIHFGAINEMGLTAIRNLGVRNLAGYFEFWTDGSPLVAYNYPSDLISHVGERDIWRDTEKDITYSRIDRVMNLAKTVSENTDKIREVLNIPTRSNWIELMIHEQYFYPEYGSYIAEFGNIVYECCKLLNDNGFESEFFEEYAHKGE